MANENPPPPGNQGGRRRRPPVIDLEAREVPPEAAEPQPQSEASPPQPEDTSVPPPPPPPPESPRAEPEPPPDRRSRLGWLPEELSWSYASAGLGGAAGGLLVVLLLWLTGAFSGAHDSSANGRLTAIEKQLNDLAARSAPAGVDPKALDDIAARLAKIESAQAAPRAPVTDPVVLGRLNAAESAVKSLADNAAALSRRAEAADAAVRDTNGRIEKLNATLTEVQTTARAAAAGSDRASRLAVAASALRSAVERGDPFTAELAIVKQLAPDANAVAVLEPFAASGVPSNAALGQELAALVRPLLKTSEEAPAAARSGSFLDKLQANAEKLVRVRPVNEEPRGDDRSAILSRIEQRASRGDIAGVRAEMAKLPVDAAAPLQAWIGKAAARDKAIEASRKLSADAVAALKAAP